MKKIIVLMLAVFLLVGCQNKTPLKIFALDEAKIVEATATDEGYSYRFLTQYGQEGNVQGVMEVVVTTDEEYLPLTVSFNPIGASNYHQTMNPEDDTTVYGIVTCISDPEVSYRVVADQNLADFYQAHEDYTVEITKDSSDGVEMTLNANRVFNVVLSYEFVVLEDQRGQLVFE